MSKNQLLQRMLSILAVLFLTTISSAADVFEYQDAWYEPIEGDPKGVAVAPAPEGRCYKGKVQLPSLVFKDGVGYTVKAVLSNTFQGDSITSLSLPPSIRKIDKCGIYGCYNLTELTLPLFLDSLESFAVSSCVHLKSLALPSGLKKMNGNCLYNLGITSLRIPAKVETIEPCAFVHCTDLATMTVDEANEHFMMANGYLASKDGQRLVACLPADARTSLELPTTVTSIAPYAFYHQENITSLIVPSHVTSVDEWAFGGCRYAKKVHTGDSVKEIPQFAFSFTSRCEDLTLGGQVTSIGNNAFESCGDLKDNMTRLVLPTTLSKIGKEAFTSSGISEMELPSGLEVIDSMAFAGMAHLATTAIPASVREIRFLAFRVCGRLANVTLPAGLTYLGDGAFVGCTSFTEVTIPASVSFVGKRCFASCTKLTAIKVENGNTKYFATGGVLFTKDMQMMKQYPAGKTDTAYNVPGFVKQIEGGCFAGSQYLKSAQMHDNITSLGVGVFQDCRYLTRITLPWHLTEIPEATFLNCTELEAIDLPPAITTIGYQAFQQCTSLSSLKLPRHLDTIHNLAFYCVPRCALKDVYVDRADPPTFLDNGKRLNPFAPTSYTSATLHVPSGTVEKYRQADIWSKFTKIVEDPTLEVETPPNEDGVSIEVTNGGVVVKSATAVNVDVYSLSGMKVWRGTAPATTTALNPGVYVVRAGEKTVKVRI